MNKPENLQKLVISSVFLKHDGTWALINHTYEPMELRNRVNDCFDIGPEEARNLSIEVCCKYLEDNPTIGESIRDFTILTYRYEYKSTTAEAIFGDLPCG